MPRVMSGTYASATVTTALTAGPKAKGSERPMRRPPRSPSQTATPKRISARLSHSNRRRIAAVGQAKFRVDPAGKPVACPVRRTGQAGDQRRPPGQCERRRCGPAGRRFQAPDRPDRRADRRCRASTPLPPPMPPALTDLWANTLKDVSPLSAARPRWRWPPGRSSPPTSYKGETSPPRPMPPRKPADSGPIKGCPTRRRS